MKQILSLILCLIIIGCSGCKQPNSQNNKENNTLKIDSIQVYYFKSFFFQAFHDINCNDIFKMTSKNKTITNRDTLDLILHELSLLTPDSNEPYLDARLTTIIFFNDKKISQLCLLGPYATYIYLNNGVYKYNSKLVYMLKYASDYYSWIPKQWIEEMPEVRDTTFIKKPIIMTLENNPKAKY